MTSRAGNGNKNVFFVLILATAEQVRTTQLFNIYRSNFNLLLLNVPPMAHTVQYFCLN